MSDMNHTFTVKGRGPFPIDMLRYDSAWPARQEDVVQIENAQSPAFRNAGPRLVRLETSRPRNQVPTIDRWKSFGWQVLTPLELADEETLIAERKARQAREDAATRAIASTHSG